MIMNMIMREILRLIKWTFASQPPSKLYYILHKFITIFHFQLWKFDSRMPLQFLYYTFPSDSLMCGFSVQQKTSNKRNFQKSFPTEMYPL